MKTAVLKTDQCEARRKYRSLRLNSQAFDNQRPEIRKRLLQENKAAERIYFHASHGRKIINLQETFQLAGVDENGWPKLAIEQADHKFTWCRAVTSTMLAFGQFESWYYKDQPHVIALQPQHRLVMGIKATALRALVPSIPIEHMPKGRLNRYHILWEAVWTQVAPRDPMLLQHIAGDAWRVLAEWDLTDVERAVLSGRFLS